MPVSSFTSYIVFSERCSLKSVPENTDQVIIARRPDMLKKLRAQLLSSVNLYSPEDMLQLVQKLQPLTNKSEMEKQQHIGDIKEKCPFCGRELVLRRGKYGQFWGCSTYPKCKFTRPLK